MFAYSKLKLPLFKVYSQLRFFSQKKTIIKNEEIKFPQVRVVYTHPTTNKPEHTLFTRVEALAFAKGFGLDLVLLNENADPPVCKLIDSKQQVVEDFKKKRTRQLNASKAKPVKEIFISAGIDSHDLATKMKRIKEFLDEGHQVKVGVTAKRKLMEKDGLILEQSTLKILELAEEFVGTITPTTSNSPLRRDFILNPKK